MCLSSFPRNCASYSLSHQGWHFHMLFQRSKLKARTPLLPRFSGIGRLSFEPWALKVLAKIHDRWDCILVHWCSCKDKNEVSQKIGKCVILLGFVSVLTVTQILLGFVSLLTVSFPLWCVNSNIWLWLYLSSAYAMASFYLFLFISLPSSLFPAIISHFHIHPRSPFCVSVFLCFYVC